MVLRKSCTSCRSNALRSDISPAVDSDQGILFVPTPVDSPGAQACLDAYFQELTVMFPEGFDPGRSVSADLALRQPEDQWIFRSNWRANDYQARLRG